MLTRLFVFVLGCAAVICASDAPTDPAAMLEGVRKRVAQDYGRLPNYTCRQTIERAARPPGSRRWSPLDSLRLDVALISGRELFAWPGSSKFEDKRIEDLVKAPGAIGNGTFATHLRALFLAKGPQFFYAGETEYKGRRAVRFDFKVAREKSVFEVGDGENRAVVAYAGWFVADRETLDLLRLELRADEVPAPLAVRSTRDIIEYARTRIGEADFLLPVVAEMIVSGRNGETRNVTRFDRCRQYVGESVISFGEPAPSAETPREAAAVALPAGLGVELRLETAVSAQTAVGDPVEAVLPRALKSKEGRDLLPKGARFTGRVTRIERRKFGPALDYCVIGVTLDSFQAPGAKGSFFGKLESVGISTRAEYHVPHSNGNGTELNVWTNFRHETAKPEPGEGVFYVRREEPRTPRGLRMFWRTAER